MILTAIWTFCLCMLVIGTLLGIIALIGLASLAISSLINRLTHHA